MKERFIKVIKQEDPIEAAQRRIAALRAGFEAEEKVLEEVDGVLEDSGRSNAGVKDLLSSIPPPRDYTSSVKSQSPRISTTDAFGLNNGGERG